MTDLPLAENEKIALIQRTLTAMGPRRGFELIPDDGVMSDEEGEASWKANERRSSTGLPTLLNYAARGTNPADSTTKLTRGISD
jgi:hypothetical protein